MIRLLIVCTLLFISANAEERVSSAALIKQKIEIKQLKKDLNVFYNKKEKEYQTRKKELETLLAKIEKERKDIQAIRDNNMELLKDIKGEVESKTSKIYNKMKPKIAAGIFNQMINEGKIEDVFAIILKIKESKVTSLLKFLSPKSASLITQMLQNYRVDNVDNNEG